MTSGSVAYVFLDKRTILFSSACRIAFIERCCSSVGDFISIDVAHVTRLADRARNYGITAEEQAEYDGLAVAASNCIGCRACNLRCPFGVNAMVNINMAAVLFEND